MKAIATVSMYDMGAANRNGLNKSQTVNQRKEAIAAAAAQRYAELSGGKMRIGHDKIALSVQTKEH